jgi:hypothetical protein
MPAALARRPFKKMYYARQMSFLGENHRLGDFDLRMIPGLLYFETLVT